MEVIIDIIDTQDDTLTLQLEKSVRSSVILDWKGGDKSDELTIVGSSLSFTMVGMSCEDGQYYDLFTGDETRFKVRMYTPEDVTIWTGFLLPDAYSEPYRDSPIPVKFMATDGLGRLKGKYLPDDFYKEEKSVIEILSACLQLTGMDINTRFSPAIENYQQKDYNQIYIDTALYKEKDKKDDAYSILDELLTDMLCVIYQADNYFNIEGSINVRNSRVYKAKEYTIEGAYIGEFEITRLRKDITGLATPYVDVQPPYGVVEVIHEREEFGLSEEVYKEENDGWVRYGMGKQPYATQWIGRNGFYAYGEGSFVTFGRRVENQPHDQVIILRNQPYVQKGKKYKLTMNFGLATVIPLSDEQKQPYIDNGDFTNPFLVWITITNNEGDGSDVIIANAGTWAQYREIQFDINLESENEFYFIPERSGLLNIRLGAIELPDINPVFNAAITDLKLEELGFKDEQLVLETLTEEYTLKKEITLNWADDSAGISKSFRLAKLKEPNEFQSFTIPVQRSFTYQGQTYHVVDLQGAVLISDNIDTVLGATVKEVIYNYQGSQDHVVLTEESVVESFTVRVYDFNSVIENRDYWEQWTDTLYKIEQERYAQTVADIIVRGFDVPLPKVPNINVKNNVKFNDFILFQWRNVSEWMITNCSWDIDGGYTDLTMVQTYYGGDELKRPIVELGPDIYYSDGNFVVITSESYSPSPDSFIVSYFWEQLTDTEAVIEHQGEPTTNIRMLESLGGPFYGHIGYAEFRLTVTDNNGLTGSDTVSVYRVENVEFELNEVFSEASGSVVEKHFQVVTSPNISSGALINLKGVLSLVKRTEGSVNITSSILEGRIKIDGVYITEIDNRGQGDRTVEQNFSINYLRDSEIIFELLTDISYQEVIFSNWMVEAYSRVQLQSAQYINGTGTITGIPQTAQAIFTDQND